MERTKHILAYIADEKDAINEEDHSINFVISSDKLDRHQERVEVSAIAGAIKDFAKNPVALACHLHRLSDGRPPVIGSWDTDSFKTKAHSSEMRLRFAADTELGKEYWTLYSQKHMRAVSIGFRILDGHEETTGGTRIYIIDKIELYEISCVPVGANREAVSKHKELWEEYSTLPKGPVGGPGSTERFLSSPELSDLKSEIEHLKSELADQFDELQDLIINSQTNADPEGFAKGFLGTPDDPDPSAGEKKNAELFTEIIGAVTTALQKLAPN